MFTLEFHPIARAARRIKPHVYVLIDAQGHDVDVVGSMEMGKILIAEDDARRAEDA